MVIGLSLLSESSWFYSWYYCDIRHDVRSVEVSFYRDYSMESCEIGTDRDHIASRPQVHLKIPLQNTQTRPSVGRWHSQRETFHS